MAHRKATTNKTEMQYDLERNDLAIFVLIPDFRWGPLDIKQIRLTFPLLDLIQNALILALLSTLALGSIGLLLNTASYSLSDVSLIGINGNCMNCSYLSYRYWALVSYERSSDRFLS